MSDNQFQSLGLSDNLLSAITKKGFTVPSDIQALTIPFVLGCERDFIAQAQTGTGKTAAFGLPILQLLERGSGVPQALILAPTRELALQVSQELESFNDKGLGITTIYGGAPINEQLSRLRRGVDIVVGTPGRMLDHIRRGTLDLSEIQFLVLDEADEMLNMGFIEDIEMIMPQMPDSKRVLLFSATMPDRIAALSRKYMNQPEVLKVETKNVTNDLVTQIYYEIREADKFEALTRVIDIAGDFYGIVFCKTKMGVDDTVKKLIEKGYKADALHGDVSQAQRERILAKFKKQQINILVATDVAARGIDVNNLTHVVNHSLPQENESYVHRIGRTGRAGNKGVAISFISPSETRQFGYLKKQIGADVIVRSEVPTPAEIVALKREKIMADLGEIINTDSFHDSVPIAFELLENLEPEVALAAVLRLAFKDELNERNYAEIRSVAAGGKSGGKGRSRIVIALGSGDGYTSRKIVKMLKSECGLGDREIDDVQVEDTYCYATVPAGDAGSVVGALNRAGGGDIAHISKEKVGMGVGGGRDRRRGGGGGYGRRGNGGGEGRVWRSFSDSSSSENRRSGKRRGGGEGGRNDSRRGKEGREGRGGGRRR